MGRNFWNQTVHICYKPWIQTLVDAAQWAALIQIEGYARPTKPCCQFHRPEPPQPGGWNWMKLVGLACIERNKKAWQSEVWTRAAHWAAVRPQVWLDWKPQQLIEPLLYKLGSVITVLKGCLAASSFVRFMEPHTSQFKLFGGKMKCFVFDHVWKISSKYNASRNNKNLEHLYKFCKLKLGNWAFKLKIIGC